MFEDATFESTGRIQTQSRNWMPATLALNGLVLVALVLIPLMHPDALPRQTFTMLLSAPMAEQPRPLTHEQVRSTPAPASMNRSFEAPRLIPTQIYVPKDPEPRTGDELAQWNSRSNMPGVANGVFERRVGPAVVRPEARKSVRLSSSVVQGLLIRKTLPEYPSLARTLGMQGTVVLQAAISKEGRIEDLRVVSGPAMLQQAALDAVKTWVYRPYLLNGHPVEVETTVQVIFKMQ